ncbi:MAG: response regulator transcription factor [Bacteroidetes bacterium]|jgi:DNA-binding LytR/AlgR family response regulator|nr:response regulator transcription factor [Bacteroidota bacterium]MDF1865236.1 response regulator transcription factor [Saprospiraceae bacterium]
MKKIKCLVVDDEELARTLLENYIGRLPQLELIQKCKDPIEANEVLQHKEINLLFLDIQMPELTGIQFLKTLKAKPAVIFTTAYSEYAVEGYSLDVTDYLLKPFSFERFLQAVNKASEWIRLQRADNQTINEGLINVNTPKEFILVKSEHKIHRLRLKDIIFIQSMREYVAYYTPNGRILSLQSLKGLEIDLPSSQFLRIHKSYIVAIEKVDTLEGNQIIIGKEKLPIGASYRERVLKKIF